MLMRFLRNLVHIGSLEFLDSTGYTAFSQGNDYTPPLLTGSDVKAAQAYTDTNSTDDTPYGVQLTLQMMVLINSMMQHQLILVTEYILYMTEKL